jgi:hypothetical protein
LILVAAPLAAPAHQDDLRVELARFRGDEPEQWPSTRTARLYDRVLDRWSGDPDHWPSEEDFEALVEELHAFAREQRHDLGLFLAHDCYRLAEFAAAGRIAEGRAHAEHVSGLYPETLPDYPLLLIDMAQGARVCQELDLVADLLERARQLLDARREPEGTLLTRLTLGFERAQHLTIIGLPDLALGVLDEAANELGRVADELAPHETTWARSTLLLERLSVAITLDDAELAERTFESARAEPWYAGVDAASRREHELRRAAAWVDRERLDPAAPRVAAAELERLLADPALTGYEALFARTLLIDLEIRAGELERARANLELARASNAPARRACAEDLPTRREIDLLVLEAQLELAKGDPERVRAAAGRLEASFDGLLRRWSSAPLRDSGVALLHNHDRLKVASVLAELLLAADPQLAPERLFELVVELQCAGSLARALAGPVPSLAEVRQTLVPEDGGLVVYLPGGSSSFALSLDRVSLRVHRLPPVQDWDPLRKRFLAELGAALRLRLSAEALEEPLADLAARFLGDGLLERVGAWSALALVGLDGTGYVPFELFRGPSGERLGRTHALSYLPSLPVGHALALRLRGPSPLPGLLVVAASDAPGASARGSERLSFGAGERRLLLDGVPPAQVELVETTRATRASLGMPPEHRFGLHLIAHTVDSGRADRPRGLLFFPDTRGSEVLLPAEVEGLAVPPLVTLMACSSGQGPLRRGDDGRHHLGGAFLIAGARTVVLSPFDVGYRDSLRLFGDFYSGLCARGLAPAEALLEARRRSDAGLLGPYLVHVLGLGGVPLVAPPAPAPRSWPWLAGAGAGLVLFAWALRARRQRSR